MRSGWASVWALASALALVACGDDGPSKRLYCYEYIPGEPVDPDIAVTPANRVIVQAAGDFYVAVGTASIELTAACTSIAVGLGVGPEQIDTALTSADLNLRLDNVCALAVDAIERDGTIRLTALPGTCTTSDALVPACMKQCVPANDDCAAACDASARASAECPMPADARFGRVLALRARVGLLSDALEKLTYAETRNTAVKASCIPVIAAGMGTAGKNLTALRDAADKVIAAAKGP